MSLKVSIVLATHNKADALERTLASIFQQRTLIPFEVVVVDDGSSDRTADILARYSVVTYRIERRPIHRNPAIARNRAIALARGEILIMQSDDVIHHSPDTIEQLVAQSEQYPRAAIFARVVNVGLHNEHTVRDTLVSPRRKRPFFFLGAVRRAHVLAIGGNDEEFTQPGYEDKWLADCLQHGAGLEMRYLQYPVGFHQHHARPVERYGDPHYKNMGKLYKSKVADAQTGIAPWTAKISSLYNA